MSDKEKLAEWIDRFTNNELEGEELQKFLEMLQSDPELREEVKLDHDLNDMLLDDDILEFRKKLMMRMKKDGFEGFDPRQLLLAATLLLLIGIAFLLYYSGLKSELKSGKRNTSLVIPDSIVKHHLSILQNADSILKRKMEPDTINNPGKTRVNPKRQLALASNFTPYPAFESLAGTAMRSWDFKLVAPKKLRIPKGDALLFQWETKKEMVISLMIMDNKGNLVYERISGINKILEIRENTLIPGLYYFKFLENKEIIYFGKFEIGN